MNDLQKTSILTVNELDVSYGSLRILFGVSLHVAEGEVVVVVGRNGAGKTTLFKTISGFVRQERGQVRFNGQDISRVKAHKIARMGLKYIDQDKHVFSDLTVRENLELGGYAFKDRDTDFVLQYFPKLKTLMDRKGGNLSGGERQMLLMAMALLGKPRVLLMDEPTEGLAPHFIQDLKEVFKEIQHQTTLVIIEQNLPLTAAVAERVYAMKEGKIVAEIKNREEITSMSFEQYL